MRNFFRLAQSALRLKGKCDWVLIDPLQRHRDAQAQSRSKMESRCRYAPALSGGAKGHAPRALPLPETERHLLCDLQHPD